MEAINYQNILHNSPLGFTICKAIINHKSEVVDYAFIEVNKAFLSIRGIQNQNILFTRASIVFGQFFQTEITNFPLYTLAALYGKESHAEYNDANSGKNYTMVVQPAGELLFCIYYTEKPSQLTIVKKLEKTRQVINATQDIVFTLDKDGKHNGIYGQWAENMGIKADSLIGKTSRDLFGDNAVVHEEANQKALKGEYVIYEWMVKGETENQYFQTSLSPILNSESDVVGIAGIGRNITETKQIEVKLHERIKELNCLANIRRALTMYKSELEVCELIVAELSKAMRFPSQASVLVLINSKIYGHDKRNHENTSTIEANIVTELGTRAQITITYESGCRFLSDEQILIENVCGILKVWLDLKIALKNQAESNNHLRNQNDEYYALNEELNQINEELQSSTEELTERERQNNAIIEAIPDQLMIFDAHGRFIDCFGCDQQNWEIKSESVFQKSIYDVLPQSIAKNVAGHLDLLFKTGRPQNWSYQTQNKGNILYYNARMVHYGERKALCIIRDVTQEKKAEQSLIHHHKLMQYVIEHMQVAIAIHDKDLNYIYVSKRYLEDFNLTDQNIIGKHHYDVFPEIPAKWRNVHQRALQGETLSASEDFLVRMDGSVDYTRWECRPWYQSDDSIGGIIIYTEVITKWKMAEQALKESEESYRLFFEKSPLGIIHFDSHGVITRCNDYYAEIIGAPKSKIIGFNLSKLPDEKMTQTVQKVLNGEESAFEGHYKTHLGEKSIDIRAIYSPVKKGDTLEGGISILEDRSSFINKQKLEKELAIAKESAKFKQNFLANMSHEIRTPLSGVIGITDILAHKNLDTETREYVGILKQTSENLREIINQVLDYSKIEAGKIALKNRSFKYHKLHEDAHNLFNNLSQKNVEFESSIDAKIPEFFIADENRILQVINNLLSNAIKYTASGKITILSELISMEEESGDTVVKISISDTGTGIPAHKQENLFIPFSQLENSDEIPYEGTGLGLSICKGLVSIHGGDIGLESEPGKGSTFWFTFRAQRHIPDKEELNAKTRPHSGEARKLRILLAEDTVVNQKVFSVILNHLGHEVTDAENGKRTVEIFHPEKFDLVLMDIKMPVMDGISATRALKEKHEKLPPIVGLSANAFEGDREKYIGLGLDEYLTKPLKKEEFNELLKKFF